MDHQNEILVAESGGIVATDIKSLLKNWGYREPVLAKNKECAFKLLESQKPDLMILDCGLRGNTDGKGDAAQFISKFNVSVILLTDWITDEFKRSAGKIKSLYCLSKPFDTDELQQTIKAVLSARNN